MSVPHTAEQPQTSAFSRVELFAIGFFSMVIFARVAAWQLYVDPSLPDEVASEWDNMMQLYLSAILSGVTYISTAFKQAHTEVSQSQPQFKVQAQNRKLIATGITTAVLIGTTLSVCALLTLNIPTERRSYAHQFLLSSALTIIATVWQQLFFSVNAYVVPILANAGNLLCLTLYPAARGKLASDFGMGAIIGSLAMVGALLLGSIIQRKRLLLTAPGSEGVFKNPYHALAQSEEGRDSPLLTIRDVNLEDNAMTLEVAAQFFEESETTSPKEGIKKGLCQDCISLLKAVVEASIAPVAEAVARIIALQMLKAWSADAAQTSTGYEVVLTVRVLLIVFNSALLQLMHLSTAQSVSEAARFERRVDKLLAQLQKPKNESKIEVDKLPTAKNVLEEEVKGCLTKAKEKHKEADERAQLINKRLLSFNLGVSVVLGVLYWASDALISSYTNKYTGGDRSVRFAGLLALLANLADVVRSHHNRVAFSYKDTRSPMWAATKYIVGTNLTLLVIMMGIGRLVDKEQVNGWMIYGTAAVGYAFAACKLGRKNQRRFVATLEQLSGRLRHINLC